MLCSCLDPSDPVVSSNTLTFAPESIQFTGLGMDSASLE